MSKFVKVEGNNDFEKMGAYIKNNKNQNYYIAPKLMDNIVNSNLRSAVGISSDAIKQKMQNNVDLIAMPVYNKVFETDVFRIESIKINGSLCKIPNNIENESVVFGLDEDEEFILCTDTENLN